MYRLAKAESEVGSQTLSATYTYTNDYLTALTNASTTYTFGYGTFGLRSNIKVGSRTLATYSYTSRDHLLSSLTYGSYSYTWEHGRQLKTISNGTKTWTYTYDADGMRSSVSDGTTTNLYTYTGGQLTMMRRNGIALYFTYDATGRPQTMTYGTTTLYYLTNLQGDVIGLVNSSGQRVVSYTYDAWGNLLSTTGNAVQAEYNPLRYRGYVYDTETGLYYLQSRYYDPEIGRFLNADAMASTGLGLLGTNTYAYCNNNPVIMQDTQGNRPEICVTCIDSSGGGGIGTGSNEVEDEYVPNFIFGFLGTSPSAAIDALHLKGFHTNFVSYSDMMKTTGDNTSSADACILWYWYETKYFPNAHFVAFTMHGDMGTYYNEWSGSVEAAEYPGGLQTFLCANGATSAYIIYIYGD